MDCRLVVISGRVQGVGYRHWMRTRAIELKVCGWVRNNSNGQVEAYLCGREEILAQLVQECKKGPIAALVKEVSVEQARPSSEPCPDSFNILS